MATWAVVKAQARDMLGINLTDADVHNVPLLATDAYGNFIPGRERLPAGGDRPPAPTASRHRRRRTELVEGNPAAPISLVNAVRTGHAFLDDIAHSAVPVGDHDGNPATPRSCWQPMPMTTLATLIAHRSANGPATATYDNELLDAHYIAGDGRVNENIGLTAVHHVFHSEHNRLVEHTKDVAARRPTTLRS